MFQKKIVSLVLILAILLSVVPWSASAADTGEYGAVPIYLGIYDVDYMADQILAEIPLQGKSDLEKIQTIYDWIILHCDRYGTPTTEYFNLDQVAADVVSTGYGSEIARRIEDGSIKTRADFQSIYGASYRYDSNWFLAWFARDMMVTRIGSCGHYSALFAVLLGHLGYDCRMVDGSFVNWDGSAVEHVWNYILIGDQYYWFDIRIDHATYVRTGVVDHTYFMVADTARWEEDHIWDHTYSDLLAANARSIASLYGVVPASEDGNPFWDVSRGQYYYDPVLWAVRQGITNGVDANHFQPDSACTRGQVVTLLWRAYGMPEPSLQYNPFLDVGADQYYYKAVLWAKERGITDGTSQQTFSPEDACTRAQVVTFLWRGAGQPAGSAQWPRFADVPAGMYFSEAVSWAAQNGITQGTSESTFSPSETCSRAQIVTFLYRAISGT